MIGSLINHKLIKEITNYKHQITNNSKISNSKLKTGCDFGIKFLVLFGICNLLFGISSEAFASYISLNTTLRSNVEKNNLKVMVSTVNKGDESAFNVQAEIVVGKKSYLAEKKAELPVNSAYQTELKLPISITNPGNYPIILVLHYADANQYPFSALSTQTFIYGKEAPAELIGQLKPAKLSKSGSLKFILKNMGSSGITAKIKLVSPRELTIKSNSSELFLSPRSQAELDFKAENFSALNGSTYQLFAVTEYEKDDLHYTNIFPGTISIISSEGFLGLGYNIIYLILAALTAVFIAAQFYKRK